MAKYIADISGKLTEVQPITTSAGVGDANKIVQTDAAGLLHISLFPIGIGVDVTVAPASENLTAGNFVNKHNNASALNIRKADATTNTKPAQGFVLASVTSPANATVYPIASKNNQLSGMTIGATQWLSTTAGGVTSTPPSATGNWVQELGVAESATAMVFANEVHGWTKI